VPDADTAIKANRLIELFPRGQVWIIFISGKPFEVFKGAPVLYGDNSTQVEEGLCSKKPFFRKIWNWQKSEGGPFVTLPVTLSRWSPGTINVDTRSLHLEII
jgi:hypothetical protein